MVYPKILASIYKAAEEIVKKSGFSAGKSGRHMKFPYTISAKIAQFPAFYYMQHNNIWMYYPIGLLVSAYVFLKIHMLANSEMNQRAWAETQRRNAEKEAAAHH